MKKQIITFICLLGLSVAVNAQLKVHQNGYVSLQNTSQNASSPVSIGSEGNSSYYMSCNTLDKNGMILYLGNSHANNPANYLYGMNIWNYGNSYMNTGIKGLAFMTDSAGSAIRSSIGVNGVGRMSTNLTGIAYGVLGNISATKGAGICGSSTLDGTNSYVDDCYAGLFIGKTKVVGNLSVTGTIDGVMLSDALPENAAQVENIQTDRSSVLGKLSEIDALSYYHTPSSKVSTTEKTDAQTDDELAAYPELKELLANTRPAEPKTDVLAEQMMGKKHYALTVEQLEKVFPELVYEDSHGTKKINYVEMIPLLVQSINELQSQLNELKTADNTMLMASKKIVTSETSETTQTVNAKLQTSKLYQNTPNPFTERTEIRFSLSDEAQNAYIYIFDMQGKMQKQIPVDSSMQGITINGYELSPGMYLYSLAVNGQEIDTKRMILSK